MSDKPLRKVSETSSKITFAYDKVPGTEGYRYYVNDQPTSRTFNPDDLQVTFGKVAGASYRVVPLDVTDRQDGFAWPAPTDPVDPTPKPPTGSTKHVTYFKLGGGELPDTHAADYEALVVAQGGITDAVRQAPPALFYTSPQAAADGAYSLSEAEADPWLLRNSSGQVLRTSFGHPLIDPGSQPGRIAFTDEIVKRMNGWGADGVFHDDVQMTWSGFGGDFDSQTPRAASGATYNQASWQAACAGWCQYVGGRLKGQLGKHMIFNARGYISGDGRSDTGELTKLFWSQIGGNCATHLCIEYWVYTPQGKQRRVGPAWDQNWDGWQALVAHAHSIGTNILTLEDAPESDGTPVYGRASALLDYLPGDLFVWAQGTDPWRSSYTKNLGAATGTKQKSGNTWTRQFANGRVTIDPSAGTAQIG